MRAACVVDVIAMEGRAMHAATCYGLMHHRRRRAFFLTGTAQHVRSAPWLRETARAAAALAGLAAWSALALLLAG